MAGSHLSAVCSSPPPPLCFVYTLSSRLESGCLAPPHWPEPPYVRTQKPPHRYSVTLTLFSHSAILTSHQVFFPKIS